MKRGTGQQRLVGDCRQFQAGIGRRRCRFDQQLLQLSEIGGDGQVVVGQVVDGHLFVLGVGDHHVAEGDVPGIPGVGGPVAVVVDVLQPGQVVPVDDLAVSGFVADLVDTQDVDVQLGIFRVELGLHLVEEAKLASAVTSGRVAEVPGRDLLEVVARRDKRVGAGGRGVDVGEMKIGLGIGTDTAEHQSLFQQFGGHGRVCRGGCSMTAFPPVSNLPQPITSDHRHKPLFQPFRQFSRTAPRLARTTPPVISLVGFRRRRT